MNEENKEKVVAQKEEGKNYFLAILITLLAGLSVGFVLSILFAPKPGKELRKDIKDKSEEFIKKSKEKVEALKEVITPKKEEKEENQ